MATTTRPCVSARHVVFEAASHELRAVYRAAIALPRLGVAPHAALYQRLADLRDNRGDPLSVASLERLK